MSGKLPDGGVLPVFVRRCIDEALRQARI